MNGAKNILRRLVPSSLLSFLELIFRRTRSILIVLLNGNQARGIKVIAITGTNGKTSTASFTNQILKKLGYKTAIYTTVYSEVDGNYSENKTHMTISSAKVIQVFFAKAKKAKVDWVVLEVTSHALDQYRTYGIKVDIAMLTNLSQDHLDYHGSMDNYAKAKSKLLTDYGAKNIILNSDDEWFEYFKSKSPSSVTSIGKKNADFTLKNIEVTNSGSKYDFSYKGNVYHVKTPVIGEFNVYNTSFAILASHFTGKSLEDTIRAASEISGVAGRLERVDAGQDFEVIVDYAHTPDALKNVLIAGREVCSSKLRLVFGATGDRDKGKRVPMGEVAAKYADVVYLTDDETYTENGDLIRKKVLEGINSAKHKSEVMEIPDRMDAIRAAFKDSEKGDVVILAGIGHEDYRNMGGKKMPWSEVEISKKLLKELKK
mgnify:CR=1 FL=1